MVTQSKQKDTLQQLTSPTRNNYFYGKLLDVAHLEMEQDYINHKRWLLNRLGLGSGVLSGLEVEITEDGQGIVVQPGVAIDPYGREIIVPAPHRLDNLRQPTDETGRPTGDRFADGSIVTLCLTYHECEIEPVPVLVGECDTEEGCVHSTVRERYRLSVKEGSPEQALGSVSDEQCEKIFPPGYSSRQEHRHAACDVLSGPNPTPEADCVVLATIEIGDPLAAFQCQHRTMVYSNAVLLDLLLCLANRVDELTARVERLSQEGTA